MKLKPVLKGLLFFIAGGLLSLVVLALASYLSNQNLPTAPLVTDRLVDLDKTRLAEALHLKDTLGSRVWPAWAEMEIPILLWHQDNNFLVGMADPPPGWQAVPGDQFQGATYYANPDYDPENFAMELGGQWIASMATKSETDKFMQQVFRDILPDPLENFFPFRLLILNTEIQISGVLHETFHVYQAVTAPAKFARADSAYQSSEAYWDLDPQMESAWQKEMDLLIEAAAAQGEQETGELARQFLVVRDARRSQHGLSAGLISFETQTEWLEGLAKYLEMTIWETAYHSASYQPLPDTTSDPDFKSYQNFKSRWNQEMSQAGRQATIPGDVRFYYSGLLQARLLDKLMPTWKTKALEEDSTLENLIRQVVSP